MFRKKSAAVATRMRRRELVRAVDSSRAFWVGSEREQPAHRLSGQGRNGRVRDPREIQLGSGSGAGIACGKVLGAISSFIVECNRSFSW